MAYRWTLVCVECGKKESFSDEKDISQSHWKILAWDVAASEPRVLCDKCEYGKPGKK